MKDEISNLLRSGSNSLIDEKRRFYSILNKIISIFFLKLYADKVISKEEGHNPFSTINKKDEMLFITLRDCLPYAGDSYKRIKWLFEHHILINY